MTSKPRKRPTEDILEILRKDLDSARDLLGRENDAFNSDRLLRLSAEALLGRIGEAAKLLPDDVANGIFGADREAWIAQRIVVNHIYHRLDYDEVWATLDADVPVVANRLADRDKSDRSLGGRRRRKPTPNRRPPRPPGAA